MDNKKPESFAARLTELINKKGISRYRISKDTKITQATLSNYCNGKVNPSPSNVKQLSEYFEVDYDWLLGGDPETSFSSNKITNAKDGRASYKLRPGSGGSDIKFLITHFEERLNRKDDEIKFLHQENHRLLSLLEKKLFEPENKKE